MTECTKWIKQHSERCKSHGRTAENKWWDNCRILTNPDEFQRTISSNRDWQLVRSIRHGRNPQLGRQDLVEAERRLLKFCPESFTRTDGTSVCDERPLKRPCNGSNAGIYAFHLFAATVLVLLRGDISTSYEGDIFLEANMWRGLRFATFGANANTPATNEPSNFNPK